MINLGFKYIKTLPFYFNLIWLILIAIPPLFVSFKQNGKMRESDRERERERKREKERERERKREM